MNVRAMLAEFIATFALIFVGVGAIAANQISNGTSGLVGVALAHGLILVVMITATAAISGGHVNPAVTIGLWAARKIDTAHAIGYVIAQCFGAILGTYLIQLATPYWALKATGMGIPAVGAGIPIYMAFIMEVILTFFLVFAVYGTAVDKRAPKMGGLFIGLTVTLDILVGAPVSGAAMNPARHFGPALLNGQFENMWLYWVAPIIGGILAATVYKQAFEGNS